MRTATLQASRTEGAARAARAAVRLPVFAGRGIMCVMAQTKPTSITDPQVMRAMAHPARIEIMEHLSSTGSAVTATEMAAQVGLSPSATSYHLRELARYGLVEQAPSRGDGRERVWRSTSAAWSLEADESEPEGRAAEQALVDAYLTRGFARLHDWFARQPEEPKEWRDASVLSWQILLLTAEELRAVDEAVRGVLEPYQRRNRMGEAPESARTVAVQWAANPID